MYDTFRPIRTRYAELRRRMIAALVEGHTITYRMLKQERTQLITEVRDICSDNYLEESIWIDYVTG